MTHILKRTWGNWRFSVYIGRVTSVRGVNSSLSDGSHITMWEFDDPDLERAIDALLAAQYRYHLPHITICRSSEGGGYHAYCFLKSTWMRSVHIVSGTLGVDPGYISMCCMRQHWTLRLTDKGRGAPEIVAGLFSDRPNDASWQDLKSFVRYESWMYDEERFNEPTI